MIKKALVLILFSLALPLLASQDTKHVTAADKRVTAKDLALPDSIANAIIHNKTIQVTKFFDDNPTYIDAKGTGYPYQTPLILAAGWGHPQLVTILLERKANVDSQDSTGETALIHAAWFSEKDEKKSIEMLQALVSYNATINYNRTMSGRSALHYTTAYSLACTRLLVENDAFVNAARIPNDDDEWPRDYETPIFEAVRSYNKDVIDYLIQHDADLLVRNRDGKNILDLAFDEQKTPEQIEYIRRIMENYRQRLSENLYAALKEPQMSRSLCALIQEYIEAPNVTSKTKKAQKEPIPVVIRYDLPMSDAMKKAIEADDTATVQQEIKQNPSAVFSRFDEKTPLLYAAYSNKPLVVTILLCRGSNVASFDGNYNNALYWAAFNGSTAMVAPLLRYMTYSQITHKAAGAHKTALEIAHERFEKTDKSEYRDVIHLIIQRLECPAPCHAPVMPAINRQRAAARALTGLAGLGCLQNLDIH